MLTKADFLNALDTKGFGYFPYSSEDTFELLHYESTTYSIVRVPVEYIESLAAFAAHAYLRLKRAPTSEEKASLSVSSGDASLIERHLQQIDYSDTPSSVRFKALAMRGLGNFEAVVQIGGYDLCSDLIVAKTEDFYVYFHWYTTG